jgi:hypothetical protein
VVVGDERLGVEEVEHVALERGVRPRLFFKESDRRFVAVKGRPQLALFDQGPGPEGIVAETAGFLADAGGFLGGGFELLFRDELFDSLTGGLELRLGFGSHGCILGSIGSWRPGRCRKRGQRRISPEPCGQGTGTVGNDREKSDGQDGGQDRRRGFLVGFLAVHAFLPAVRPPSSRALMGNGLIARYNRRKKIVL